jgi:hypothetical protein
MCDLITALGAKYDGDRRLAFFQVGFLGYWGEWHSEDVPFAPKATQTAVLKAFYSAFPTTRIVARYADVFGDLNPSDYPRVGFHDEYVLIFFFPII